MFDGLPVAGLPVSVFGFQSKAGVDDEVQGGLVLKADVNGVAVSGGEELDAVHCLAFDLFHAMKGAVGIAADGGLAAPGDNRRRQEGKRVSLASARGLFCGCCFGF